MAKTNLKSVAYNSIRQKIVTCEYAPGSFLNEELLSEELKISRTPIRDALGRLEQEGLIEIKAKKGITVTPLSIRDINMIFQVRKLYEPYALKNYGSHIPEEQLNEYYKIYKSRKTDAKCLEDSNYFYELDNAFHQMIIDACPNTYLQHSYAQTQTQNERFRFMSGNVVDSRLTDTFHEHIDIIIPCLQKDWDTAVEKLLYHLDEAKKVTFQLVFDNSDVNGINLYQ